MTVPHPHVQVGWRFYPGDETGLLRQAGVIGEITERGSDGHPDFVRADAVLTDGTRYPFGGGRSFHVSTFARLDPVDQP